MKVLVTGSSGFLGTCLVRWLGGKDCQVTALTSRNCDLRDAESLLEYNDRKYDLIFHLAAWTQAGDFCLKHPGEQWVINQSVNTNTLAFWSEHQPQAKLIFMGTSCAYAPASGLREDEYMLGEPIDSLYTYAMTKRMLYQGARALSQQYGLRYLCAVPSTLYGPGYHTDGRQMHFIFDLIAKIIRGKEFGSPVVLWGDGNQRREIVLVDDFVQILWDLTRQSGNEIFNIGAGEEYPIKVFAEKICGIVGYPAQDIEYDTARYVGATSKCLNVEKLRAALPVELTPLDDGLKRTIGWFYESGAYKP